MENKNVGWLIIGISLLIIFIILLFNNAMKNIINEGCPYAHNSVNLQCPAYKTITQQTYLSLAIVGILIIVGAFLIFSPSSKVIIRKIKPSVAQKKIDTSALKREEKEVLGIVQAQGAIFQADLIENTGLGKAKITRILDRLEGLGILERKRRGMTNIVVFKR